MDYSKTIKLWALAFDSLWAIREVRGKLKTVNVTGVSSPDDKAELKQLNDPFSGVVPNSPKSFSNSFPTIRLSVQTIICYP